MSIVKSQYWYILTLSFLFLSMDLVGQSLVTPAGKTFYGDDFKISWSIGEPLITTYQISDTLFITQGFQQPYLICNPCEPKNTEAVANIFKKLNEEESILISPNPLSHLLNMHTTILFDGEGYIAIMDGLGKVRRLEAINYSTAGPSTLSIDVSDYLPGKYYIKISNGASVQSTAFIKI